MSSHALTQEERLNQMITEPVEKLIPKLAIPTIVSMLVSAIYNMADTYFVSQISTSASAAVGVIFSLMAIIQAIGFMFGMGAGVVIANSLGRGERDQASRAASTAFFTTFIIGVLICLGGYAFLKPMIYGLGATETIFPYAADYCRYILLATPFMITSFVMNNLLRSQGNAFYAMVGITTGGILNMILDPIFIFVLDMGISGAAIATMISQMISFGILLFQSQTRVGCIRLKISNFRPTLKMYVSIIHAGLPSLMRQGLASIATIILNTNAAPFGDAAIAAMSITTRIIFFIYSAMLGFGQGFQPVCGYNFGAGRYDRVMDAFYFCVKIATAILTTLGIIVFIFSKPLITAFRRDDADVIRIGVTALRLQILTMPINGWIVMCNMLTQQIGYGIRASIVAAGRQGLFLIPALMILPQLLGLLGLQLAQPVADVLTAMMATVIVVPIIREIKNMQMSLE